MCMHAYVHVCVSVNLCTWKLFVACQLFELYQGLHLVLSRDHEYGLLLSLLQGFPSCRCISCGMNLSCKTTCAYKGARTRTRTHKLQAYDPPVDVQLTVVWQVVVDDQRHLLHI
jgi:hypothetical protein